ncbi:MAG: hypothetical protein CVV49_14590 [Spirochaetae bacterium HGW-Spirochaetae-5]|nr:MAG: hypothetical protein CVV49_14590 [Spirochaetae bacterium HGW-Spirochaetae-5]
MKKYIVSLLIFIPILLFAATAEESIQQAKIKYAAGNSTEAISILDGVVKENPSNFQAKRILADICVDTGEREYDNRNFKNAYEYFKKAVKILPTHPIATERYWKMKSDFDVANLKNEGGSLPAKDTAVKDTSATGKTDESVTEKKRTETEIKEIKRIEANPRIADDIYAKKIVGMEERFNQRLLDMNAQLKKTSEQEKDKNFLSGIAGNTSLLIASIIFLIITVVIVTLIIIFLIRFIKKTGKSRKGGKEFDRLFTDNTGQYYNELIKMQNIKELINKIKSGELDWSMIKKSISEMDRELRLEVFSYIETKVDPNLQPITMGQADILMALLLDGDEYLRRRVSSFLSGQITAGDQTSIKALPFNQTAISERKNVLQITDQTSAAIDYSIMEDLNIVLPLSKIVDRKVFNDKHAERVAVDTYDMAGLLGLSQEECNLFYIAGLIHDVGYLDIPSEILNKKSSLNDKEFNIIKTHTKRGVALLDFAVLPQVINDGILYHHEKFSGEGYPEGLAGENIPLVARIISIFDMYEALILPRPQRPAFPTKEAQRIIKKGSGKIFDPELVKIFEKMAKENMLSREDIWKK